MLLFSRISRRLCRREKERRGEERVLYEAAQHVNAGCFSKDSSLRCDGINGRCFWIRAFFVVFVRYSVQPQESKTPPSLHENCPEVVLCTDWLSSPFSIITVCLSRRRTKLTQSSVLVTHNHTATEPLPSLQTPSPL